jgi:hypothetical protein
VNIDKYQLADMLAEDIREYGLNTGRSLQSAEGRLGPSDIGFCREKARLMTVGVAPTDNVPIWSAQVGTAVHGYLEGVIKDRHPDWLVEQQITATLDNGAEVTGTADIIAPDLNAVLDWKTVNGTSSVKKYGPSQNHRFQRHLYALGAVQAGLLDGSKPVWMGNVYLDRSGSDPQPVVDLSEFDPTLTPEIVAWVDDVVYAVQHQQQAQRDVAPSVCERICDRFTACRGGMLPVSEGGEWIEDEDAVKAIGLFIEAKQMEKEARKMRAEAQAHLVGVNGRTKDFQVRWVSVGPSDVPGFTRAGYERLDVIPVKEGK